MVWKSTAVVNTSILSQGMAVLRGMSLVITPPLVSTPRVRGSDVDQDHVLDLAREGRAAWMAAPRATHSSGLMSLLGSLSNRCFTKSTIMGMRVEPPTRRMRSIWCGSRRESFRDCRVGPAHFSTRVAGELLELRAG